MRTIASLKSDLIRKLHGTSLSKIESVNELIREAGGNLLSRIDPQETIRRTTIENALFDDVYSYTCPSDMKGDKIIDLGPQTDRTESQNYNKVFTEEFTRKKNRKDVNILYKNGVKFLRVNADEAPTKAVVSQVNATTGWSAQSSASNLEKDSLQFITGNASLRFDVTSSGGTATLENSTLDAIDLSATTTDNSVFLWVFLPDTSKVTSVSFRYGSSSSNYLSGTVTSAHDSTAFTEGWNLLRFDFDTATETGTVDYSSLVYFRFTINHDGTGFNNARFDNITVGVGKIYEVYYYSNALFQATDGTLKTTPTLDTDTIVLENDAYNILLYEVAHIVTQELQGENGAYDESHFRLLLDGDGRRPGLYRQYTSSYPSQNKKVRSTYYEFKAGNYRN